MCAAAAIVIALLRGTGVMVCWANRCATRRVWRHRECVHAQNALLSWYSCWGNGLQGVGIQCVHAQNALLSWYSCWGNGLQGVGKITHCSCFVLVCFLLFASCFVCVCSSVLACLCLRVRVCSNVSEYSGFAFLYLLTGHHYPLFNV